MEKIFEIHWLHGAEFSGVFKTLDEVRHVMISFAEISFGPNISNISLRAGYHKITKNEEENREPDKKGVPSSVPDVFNYASDACNRGKTVHNKYASLYTYKRTKDAEGIESIET